MQSNLRNLLYKLRKALPVIDHFLILQEEEQDLSAAIETAQRLLRSDPLQETAYSHLMRLYVAHGDRAAALRTYHACTTVLERELSVAPGVVIRESYARLLQAEKRVAPPRTTPSTRLKGRAPLVGRESEWARLRVSWQRTLAGRSHMVLLIGEAGMGKTYLVEELQAWVERQGIATARQWCIFEQA